MAKQIAGLCFLEGTIDDLTFYKMDGQYYCRAKSCLTSERVKTSPRFRLTMMSARRLARASKIGATIYKALPPRWRQFWMYRSFTGEAFTLLKHSALTEEAITAQLYACYVAYWDERRAADPGNELWQPLPVKIRKPRKYSEESLKRRWEAMRAKRPRKEIREEKRQAEEALRQAWREKLAARAAAKAALDITICTTESNSTVLQDTPVEASVPPIEKEKLRAPVGSASRRKKRGSAHRQHWYIDVNGMLQKQSVPEVTRKRPTGTRTMIVRGLPASARRSASCDSS